MSISGFDYTWDPARPVGSRVVEVRRSGAPIDRAARLSVTCNNFMAGGGDNFTTFTAATDQVGGPIDLDALVEYVEAHTPIERRHRRADPHRPLTVSACAREPPPAR